jgi:2-desacetyl-2-hydroxyethyl bacteriochlorophyllide A dehydrogenase
MQIKQVVVTKEYEVGLQDLSIDEGTLGPDQILVETETTFVSAGTELANYTGIDPRVRTSGEWCEYPWKSGYANVGIVRRIGINVSRAKIGQRVFTFGPHASAHIYDTNQLVVEVPQSLTPRVAAVSRMADVSYTPLFITKPKLNSWVAVFGLGTVGNLTAQFFRLAGCRVIGIDPLKRRRDVASECGIPHTLGGSPGEVNRAIAEITGRRMASVVIDAVGRSSVILECINACADHGSINLVGTPRGDFVENMTPAFYALHARFITIKTGSEWCVPTYAQLKNAPSHLAKHEMIFNLIERGVLKIEPLISHVMKPIKIKQAYDSLLNDPDNHIGVVIDWTLLKNH